MITICGRILEAERGPPLGSIIVVGLHSGSILGAESSKLAVVKQFFARFRLASLPFLVSRNFVFSHQTPDISKPAIRSGAGS